MTIADRIYPLCELLLGAAYADTELHKAEHVEIRALLCELAGERRVEVEACIAAFEPERFDMREIVGVFKNDTDDDKRKLLRLACTVIEADDEIDLRENEYLRELCTALELPPDALDGLIVEIELEEIDDVRPSQMFEALSSSMPPIPPPRR